MTTFENVQTVDGAERVRARHERRIGGILVEDGKLEPGDIKRVLAVQQSHGLRFGEAALRLNLITVDDLLGAIARQYDLLHLLPGNERFSGELVVAYAPFHRCAEEMRALRTQLLIRVASAGVRCPMLAIVSPEPSEGRSYVAANLAVAFSQLGERTLLIDADLRRPRQHRIFDVADRIGLSAVLSGRGDRTAVVPIPAFRKLSLLPAGARPPNPMELLSCNAFTALLRQLESDFDVILFDTPAAKLCADAQSVAFRAGSALVLSRKDHTRLADTNNLIAQLSETGARAVGTLLTAF